MTAIPVPLPVREGVAPSYIWLPQGPWPDLLNFLTERFPAVDASQWQRRMQAGDVRDARGSMLLPDAGYCAGMQVFYYREIAHEPPIPFDEFILYQDEHLLVADKPHFLPVTPSGRFLHETLLVRLKLKTGCDALVPIHRLDRETAGVVAFSLNPETRGRYQALFRERTVDKVYEALAPGRPDLSFPLTRRSRIIPGERFFMMKESGGEPNSHTEIEVLEKGLSCWRYRLRPSTGKTHQLRLHMLGLDMPILNDLLYPVVHPVGAENYEKPLKLLARSLSFIDPVSGVRHCFESARTL
ncbi:pseudouridine synthase [Lacisediminimonas profundi]|uniref:pseudouridine synthase n=1 Tax=Lacisediminimonas profundi TaxID=2603856 RepID=UPI00124B0456|nr:pseudouridine synthase [Lacisediminimonas profundi]